MSIYSLKEHIFKKIFCWISIVFISFQLQAQDQVICSKIVETYQFSDFLSEIDQNTVVFFDIDDTLINTTSILGNTAWWSYFTSKLAKVEISMSTYPEVYHVIQKIIREVPMHVIDPSAAKIIQGLQQQGILTFALTARCLNANYIHHADQYAYEHLKSVGIDFSHISLPKGVDRKGISFFSYGIIFTDYQEKGPFLKLFLNTIGLHPEKIIFIDDSPRQMKSVASVVESMGIEFRGFRYCKLDQFHRKFDALIANIQLESLIKEGRVLSDEEAVKKAQLKEYKDPDYFVNELMTKWGQSGEELIKK